MSPAALQPVLQRYSYRFADEVLNSMLGLKKEFEQILLEPILTEGALSRPGYNAHLRNLFVESGWTDQPLVFGDPSDPGAKMDFLKGRVGVVGFGHASFIGIDLLKFQVGSYSGLDKIDVGVYVVTTSKFQRAMKLRGVNWEGSLTFEKVKRYLPHFKSAIQVPIYVLGLDAA